MNHMLAPHVRDAYSLDGRHLCRPLYCFSKSCNEATWKLNLMSPSGYKKLLKCCMTNVYAHFINSHEIFVQSPALYLVATFLNKDHNLKSEYQLKWSRI
jgi:hypothetical protein